MTTQTQAAPLTWIVAPKSDYQIGFDLYAAGHADSACANHDQVTGWYDACAAEAACSTIDHMATQGASAEDFDVFLSSIEDDYEWIRRGC